MSKEIISIHEFDLDLICDYYSLVERQGPGSPEITLKALGFIDGLSPDSKIVDIGCGTGGQTMVLAQHTEGEITGLDLFPKFIDKFNNNASKLGFNKRVNGLVGSMDDLPFEEESLDLIWSEGAIYNIGFEKGLREWRAFLKQDGFIAVTEASWFTKVRPDEINDFWMMEYPGIDTIDNKVDQMQKAGYKTIAAFILPEECWTTYFYEPQVHTQEIFLQENKGNKAAKDFIAGQRHETDLYYKYKDYYGYVFYIGQKIE